MLRPIPTCQVHGSARRTEPSSQTHRPSFRQDLDQLVSTQLHEYDIDVAAELIIGQLLDQIV